ncbi:UNKNOWN [Stylonychia lemnae]|uniref:Uncharacterized protein n=1 Tax=Stylonychia lemnae TaxID=5949 RepID=A0A078AYT2_STYLE|nr:UNKNOWN [Stylonychia lemnae]|eukprot:CDW87595.1 UNKNOWN [Stylonychia lemnae]
MDVLCTKNREDLIFAVQDKVLKCQSIKVNNLINPERAQKLEKQGKFDFFQTLNSEQCPRDSKKQKVISACINDSVKQSEQQMIQSLVKQLQKQRIAREIDSPTALNNNISNLNIFSSLYNSRDQLGIGGNVLNSKYFSKTQL